MGFGFIPEMRSQRENFANSISGIWSGINKIWDQLNVEIKHHDLNQAQVNINTVAPSFYSLAEISAGVGGGSTTGIDVGVRDGDKIRTKTVHIKGEIVQVASNTQSQNVTVYLVKHYDNMLGSSPNFNQLFDQYTGTFPTNRLRNLQNKNQYKILKSRKFRLPPGNSGDEDVRKSYDIYHKFRRSGSHIEWEGGSAGDPSNGKLYLVICTDTQGSSGSNPPQHYFTSRITYVDN